MNTPQTDWQQSLSSAFTSTEALCQYLSIPTDNPHFLEAGNNFPIKVTREFADLMQKGNPDDPLLRQVIPLSFESLEIPGFEGDPVGDCNAIATPGVIQKYQSRALLIVTGACAIHCRYCFRREFPYGDQLLSRQKISNAINYINEHTELTEIILSGGDPLLLNNQRLRELILQLEPLKHLKRLRIHTRIPLVLPSRIDIELLNILKENRFRTSIVIHCNHPNELATSTKEAITLLKNAGLTLLNQSVLLKGINDTPETLIGLSESLFDAGVLPYYLHQLDRAIGTSHFEVPDSKAKELHLSLQRTLPGYLVPKLVREVAGAPHKLMI